MSTLDTHDTGLLEPVTTEDGDAYRTTHDFAEPGSLGITVVEAISAIIGESPPAIEPLYDVVDPDALDALFRPRSDDIPRLRGAVTFEFGGCEVTVEGTGAVIVVPFDR